MNRSKNDMIMLGAVAVLGVLAVGMVVVAVMERPIPDALASLSVGVLGAVAGYVTAGRTPAQTSDTNVGLDILDPPPGYQGVDPGIEGDPGPDYGDEAADWFE